MKKTLKWLGVVVALLLVGWWLWARYGVTEEKRVRKVIAKMQEAVERGGRAKMALGLEGCIAQDFADRVGLNKTMLIEALIGYRSQFDSVNIDISDLTITVTTAPTANDFPTAEAKFAARLIGNKSGQNDQYSDRFRLTFKKSDLGWQMTNAEGEQTRNF